MQCRFLVIVAILHAHAEATSTASQGDAACPCIDPWATTLAAADGQEVSDYCPIRDSTGFCFASPYGAGECSAWDAQSHPACQVPKAPGWCQNTWCYIDPQRCARHPQRSSFVFNYTNAVDEPLTYSYATCGSLDSFHAAHSVRLSNNVLRVSFPNNEAYLLKTIGPGEEEALPGTNKTGSYVMFAAHLFEANNVTYVNVPVSAEALATYSSSYTACAHEASSTQGVEAAWLLQHCAAAA